MSASFRLVTGSIFAIVLVGLGALQSRTLILAIPLLIYLFAAILQRPEDIRLEVYRDVSPDHAPQGTPIVIKLVLTNRGAAIDEIAVRDILPDGVTQVEGESSAISFFPAQDTCELEYTVEARRGKYDIYETLVLARDFTGLFEQSRRYRTTPRLMIQPRYSKLTRIKIRPSATRGFAGPITTRQGGIGIDFWGVREYQSGDPQRQVNWRLNARSEHELYTNVFEQERVADVGLILDARQRTNITATADSLFEHAVRATAALAECFLADGNRVSLLVFGHGLTRVFPGYGKVQHDRILRELSQVEPGLNYAMESLTQLPTRLFPAKSQLVLISSLLPEDEPAIVRLRAHGYEVMVISPDPIAYAAALSRDTVSAAYKLACAERNLMLRRLRRGGVQLVDWQVTQPLENAVYDTLIRQQIFARHRRIRL